MCSPCSTSPVTDTAVRRLCAQDHERRNSFSRPKSTAMRQHLHSYTRFTSHHVNNRRDCLGSPLFQWPTQEAWPGLRMQTLYSPRYPSEVRRCAGLHASQIWSIERARSWLAVHAGKRQGAKSQHFSKTGRCRIYMRIGGGCCTHHLTCIEHPALAPGHSGNRNTSRAALSMADSEGVYIGPSRGGEGASCAEAFFLDYFAGKLWPARHCRHC